MNTEALNTALAGDQYGWLRDRLPSPIVPLCDQCATPMVFRTVPLVFVCSNCHPGEAAP